MNQKLTEHQEPYAFSFPKLAPLSKIFPHLRHEPEFLLRLFSLGDEAQTKAKHVRWYFLKITLKSKFLSLVFIICVYTHAKTF